MSVVIKAADLAGRRLQLANGEIVPITGMFNRRGLPTSDENDAVLCLAGESPRTISFKLAAFDPRKLQ